MKIVLYGISRVGKDTLITRLVEKLNGQLSHVKGSSTLKNLSQKYYIKDFSELTIIQKNNVRELFIDYLNSLSDMKASVIVDGHYAFPNQNNDFNVVFTDADLNAYDVFVYLKQSPDNVIKNTQNSISHAHYSYLQNRESIEKWMNYEIQGLSQRCFEREKDFILVDGDYEDIIDFMMNLVINPESFLSSYIAQNLFNKILKNIVMDKQIILLDCDKTVSIDDPTMALAKGLMIDKSQVKEIFLGDYYTVYQFYRLHKLLHKDGSGELITHLASITELNQNLIKDIKKHPSKSLVIGITTGLSDLWHVINEQHAIFDVLIGYGHTKATNVIHTFVTPIVKGKLAKMLNSLTPVKVVGDSIIDIWMLKHASQGFVVVNGKRDERIQRFIDQIKLDHVYQFSYNKVKYEHLTEVETIW